MNYRIRLALGMGSELKSSGEVEIDQTVNGVESRSMCADVSERRITVPGPKKR